MNEATRVPEWADKSHAGMNSWFSIMADRGLLFHPDDPPDTIVSISDNIQVFTMEECNQINDILDDMFDHFGNDIYEAAIPVYQGCLGIRYDS